MKREKSSAFSDLTAPERLPPSAFYPPLFNPTAVRLPSEVILSNRMPTMSAALIGICPQELALYADMSAFDNLVFFGRMAGLSSQEAREQAMANLELMGLADRAKKGKVDKFSGGMKRRVNLAIALMGHPQLLFLDEPTVGIDPQSRNNIYETIEGLRDKGMTILYTTHYMEEADRLCKRVAIMDGGKIIALDTPHALEEPDR